MTTQGVCGLCLFGLFMVANILYVWANIRLARYEKAMRDIIKECGDLDQSRWPVPQQKAQNIALSALAGEPPPVYGTMNVNLDYYEEIGNIHEDE